MVGMAGFEPAASGPPDPRSTLAELHPEKTEEVATAVAYDTSSYHCERLASPTRFERACIHLAFRRLRRPRAYGESGTDSDAGYAGDCLLAESRGVEPRERLVVT